MRLFAAAAMTTLADLESSLVLLVDRYALSCLRRDCAVSRRWHEILQICCWRYLIFCTLHLCIFSVPQIHMHTEPIKNTTQHAPGVFLPPLRGVVSPLIVSVTLP